MATLGWVFLAVAFLMLIMVANNSAKAVWQRITGGIAQGEGNRILPVPPESGDSMIPPTPGSEPGPTPGTIMPVEDSQNPPFTITPVP